jgi:MSHA pilin protein MshA
MNMKPHNPRRTRRTRGQTGFTLIELIIVILILGILSAIALPKFYDLSSSARTAKLNAVFGAMRASAEIVHAAALVNNIGTTATGTVLVEGVTVNTVYGYPEGTVLSTGIVSAAGFDINTTSNNDQLTLSATAGTATVQINGAATPASCQITYAAATSATVPPVFTKTATSCS